MVDAQFVMVKKKWTTPEIVAAFIIIHKGKDYGYSKVNYVNSKTKITIICNNENHPGHEFQQSPGSHLMGKGCKKCGILSMTNKKIKYKTIQDIENYGNEKYNFKYGYQYVKFPDGIIDLSKPILIVCPIHNIFPQIAYNHLYSGGCKQCGYIQTGDAKRLDMIIVKERASEKFKGTPLENNFGYDESNYKTNHDPIKIYCKIHEKYFIQQPRHHMQGSIGCSDCDKSRNWSIISMDCIDYFRKYAKIINDPVIYEYIIYLKEPKYGWTKKLYVDGFFKKLNLCIEFSGAYYHGCIEQNCKCSYRTGENKQLCKTYEELRNRTELKKLLIKEYGYDLIEINECLYRRMIKEETFDKYVHDLMLKRIELYRDNKESKELSKHIVDEKQYVGEFNELDKEFPKHIVDEKQYVGEFNEPNNTDNTILNLYYQEELLKLKESITSDQQIVNISTKVKEALNTPIIVPESEYRLRGTIPFSQFTNECTVIHNGIYKYDKSHIEYGKYDTKIEIFFDNSFVSEPQVSIFILIL
jgi:hypothetical protein